MAHQRLCVSLQERHGKDIINDHFIQPGLPYGLSVSEYGRSVMEQTDSSVDATYIAHISEP
jgi:hypothetical protein